MFFPSMKNYIYTLKLIDNYNGGTLILKTVFVDKIHFVASKYPCFFVLCPRDFGHVNRDFFVFPSRNSKLNPPCVGDNYLHRDFFDT